ncbi:MAG: hypothetical protein Q4G68_09115 [Planctomycetia bacterium]|nr:hypothetical protein [Planctomycetia bacterium]
MFGLPVRPHFYWGGALLAGLCLAIANSGSTLYAQLSQVNLAAPDTRPSAAPTTGTRHSSGERDFYANSQAIGVSGSSVRTDDRLAGQADAGQSRDLGMPYTINNRVRPPMPSKQKADNYYPQGFLRPSKPTVVASDPVTPAAPAPATVPAATTEPAQVAPAPLEKVPAPGMDAEKNTVLFAVLVAGALSGVFVLLDYRYRVWLQSILAQNARLLAPDATVSDFEGILSRSDSLSPTLDSGRRLFETEALADSYNLYSTMLPVSPFSPSVVSNSYDGFCVAPQSGDPAFETESHPASDFHARGAGALS